MPRRKKLRELLFMNPKFHDGINVTVRLGDKWKNALGEDVILKETDSDETYGVGEIVGTYYDSIGEIPDGILKLEHDKDCTNVRGIWRVMEETYDRSFSFYEKVTVLFFKRTDKPF